MNNPEYFSLQELAVRWKLSDPTLRRMMKDGRLATFRMGNRIRVLAEEVERIENGWRQELDANRQAWNQQISERRKAMEE
jgi:excisionase family DNA binding protein